MNVLANLYEHTKKYLIKANALPSLVTMTAQEAREMRAKAPKLKRPVAKLKSIKQQAITMRDGHQIAVRIYTPVGQGPFDIIVYYHGGGWVLNDLNTCHESCSYLAQQTNQIVVSVEYRLAPEFKFPTPVFDAFDSFVWVREHASSFGGNTNRISVAGDSAGGNLAVAVSQLAAQNEWSITSQILLYPVTELSYSTNSYSLFEKGFGLDREVMQWFGDYYITSQNDANNPLVSPLQLTNYSHFPPTLLFAAENDVLRDEALEFAKRLRQAGVQTTAMVMEGIVHSYFTHNDVFEREIQQTIDQVNVFLKRLSKDSSTNN